MTVKIELIHDNDNPTVLGSISWEVPLLHSDNELASFSCEINKIKGKVFLDTDYAWTYLDKAILTELLRIVEEIENDSA